MAIPTREALSGFIATDPQLTETTGGGHRFYARVGIEQFQRNEDGSFTQLESEFTNLVMFDKAAERAAEKFQKGDNFIAEGRSNVQEYQGDQREQFIASRIGHDNNRTTYTVDRTRQERSSTNREAPERAVGERDPAAVALAQREQALQPETAAPNASVPADRAAVAR
ncbi:single-stranded DNA-binding protein [Microbacterium sp. NPDC078814]|uniref:single-stranded DNA-binding protein n=1 Tax=Microbacterium sp. NPDC078814 TaxID=3154767 RepID=UPI00344FF110